MRRVEIVELDAFTVDLFPLRRSTTLQDLKITMSTGTLLERVRENRSKHEKEQAGGVLAWRRKAAETLRRAAAKYEDETLPLGNPITIGDLEPRFVIGSPPPCHLADYDQAIAMLEAHTGETFEIGQGTFAELVLDRWSWSGHFRSTYLAATSPSESF